VSRIKRSQCVAHQLELGNGTGLGPTALQTIAAQVTPSGLTCTDAIIILADTWLIPRMSRPDCRVLIWSAAGWSLRQQVRVSVSVVAVMISWADGNRRVRPCRPGEARPG
jgi:hypothetical protein